MQPHRALTFNTEYIEPSPRQLATSKENKPAVKQKSDLFPYNYEKAGSLFQPAFFRLDGQIFLHSLCVIILYIILPTILLMSWVA